jgi:transposase
MSEEPIRKIITDAIWKKLEAALAVAKHSAAGAPPQLSDRDFFEALLYLNRTGTPWRDLPKELGAWDVVYMRFRRWTERGVWQRLWQDLQAAPFADARDLLLDSTTVRAHPHAAGAPKKRVATKLWGGLPGDLAPRSTQPPSTKTARSHST